MMNMMCVHLFVKVFSCVAGKMLNLSASASSAGWKDGLDATQGIGKLQDMLSQLLEWGVTMGTRILGALVIFIVGRYVVKLVNKLVARLLSSRNVDPSVKSFVESFVNVLLLVLLIIAVISKLGVETTSFAALLASFGVAVGMALSGNLQNLAGGIIILVFRPYKVGDYISAQGQEGTVMSIQIFHTVIRTYKGVNIFMPNGQMSSNTIVNFSKGASRMVEWIVGIDYGEDVARAERAVLDALSAEKRIQSEPAPLVAVKELADSSVSLTVRVWVEGKDYTSVLMAGNRLIYDEFNRQGINFPYPQLTVHQVKD